MWGYIIPLALSEGFASIKRLKVHRDCIV